MDQTEKKHTKNISVLKYLIIIWVAAWSFNLLGQGTKIIFGGGLFLILLLIFKNRNIQYSTIFVFYIVFLFGVSYSIILSFYVEYDFFRGFREMLLPMIIYLVGVLVIDRDKPVGENLTFYKNIFITIALGMFAYGIINLIVHLNTVGEVSLYRRMVYDIWNGEQVEATAQGSRFTILVAMLSPLILVGGFFRKNTRLLLLSCIIGSLISSLIMANRSIFVILIFSFIAGSLIYLKIIGSSVKGVIKYISITFTFIGLFILIYQLDVFGIKTYYIESNLSNRVEDINENWLFSNPRTFAWMKALQGIYLYPMGGYNTDIALSFVHNLWLDVGYATGIIPLILLIIVTFLYIVYFLKILKHPEINYKFKVFFVSLTFALLLNLMIEPILEGHYFMFMIFIFQLGLMHGLVHTLKQSSIVN